MYTIREDITRGGYNKGRKLIISGGGFITEEGGRA